MDRRRVARWRPRQQMQNPRSQGRQATWPAPLSPLICKSPGAHQQQATAATQLALLCSCKSVMAATRGLVLVRELLRPQGNTTTTTASHRLRGMGVVGATAAAGFLGSASVASAASDSDGGAACCPAYPWPQDGARGGKKVFMQHDCAACHSALPYSVHAEETTAALAVEAEIVVVHVHEEAAARPPPAPLRGAACPPEPDLSVIARMLEGLRRSNLYNADELKNRTTVLPSAACMQFLQPYYTRTPQAA